MSFWLYRKDNIWRWTQSTAASSAGTIPEHLCWSPLFLQVKIWGATDNRSTIKSHTSKVLSRHPKRTEMAPAYSEGCSLSSLLQALPYGPSSCDKQLKSLAQISGRVSHNNFFFEKIIYLPLKVKEETHSNTISQNNKATDSWDSPYHSNTKNKNNKLFITSKVVGSCILALSVFRNAEHWNVYPVLEIIYFHLPIKIQT